MTFHVVLDQIDVFELVIYDVSPILKFQIFIKVMGKNNFYTIFLFGISKTLVGKG